MTVRQAAERLSVSQSLIYGLASISTAGILAPQPTPVCTETPCFKGFSLIGC